MERLAVQVKAMPPSEGPVAVYGDEVAFARLQEVLRNRVEVYRAQAEVMSEISPLVGSNDVVGNSVSIVADQSTTAASDLEESLNKSEGVRVPSARTSPEDPEDLFKFVKDQCGLPSGAWYVRMGKYG